MRFKNRELAGKELAQELQRYKGSSPLVLGIPRGAIPMAQVIAEALDGELNAVFVKKIGAPGHEEFAVACAGLSGNIQKLEYADTLKIPDDYIRAKAQEKVET